MTVTPKCLINTQYIPAVETVLYTTPLATTTIIDKFTVANTTGSALTVTIKIIPATQTSGNQHILESVSSLAANATTDFSALQNQILATGDMISVLASAVTSLTIRVSGRAVT